MLYRRLTLSGFGRHSGEVEGNVMSMRIAVDSPPRCPLSALLFGILGVDGRGRGRRVGFDLRSFPPLDSMSPVSHPTCDVHFPPSRPAEYRKGMIPARPLFQGFRGSVWDPDTSRERVDDWGRLETVWALLCVAERRATRPNGEWGYSTRRHILDHECPEAVSPERGVVLTDLQPSIHCQ